MHSVRSVRKVQRGLVALVVVGFVNSATFGAIVNFESLAVDQTFGSDTQVPGQMIFSEGGIHVTVETFRTGSFQDMNLATINGPGTDLFATKHVSFNNINFGFDLTGVAPITSVMIDYHEFGGVNNFSVNGGPLLELPAMTSLPVNVAPGVTASVDADSIHLSGVVSRFVIGGQELAVDNIVAVPEPTCLAILAAGLGAGLLKRRR